MIADAASQGFSVAEGYVNEEYSGRYWDHTGPTRLYEKFGFVPSLRQNGRIVMRKKLA